jgi:hypothetical protein
MTCRTYNNADGILFCSTRGCVEHLYDDGADARLAPPEREAGIPEYGATPARMPTSELIRAIVVHATCMINDPVPIRARSGEPYRDWIIEVERELNQRLPTPEMERHG